MKRILAAWVTALLACSAHAQAPQAAGPKVAVTSLVGGGLLEGLGFYLDPAFGVQSACTSDSADGPVAAYLYVVLRLVDLNALEVRAVQAITASTTVAAARNPSGADPWGALTAEEKMNALQGLIRRRVGEAAPLLFQSK